MYLDAFTEHFSIIQEPRQTAKVTYPLFDILFATLCAVIAGAESWKEIQEYAEGHLDWFQKHGLFQEGVPVDDTIARIIARIKPDEFNQCFINWMQSVNTLTEGDLVALDGKTLRGSYNREDRRSTIHRVSVYATANKVVIGQVKTDNKSNEITAIPELIKLLALKGALVSIDAMGCQTEIASAIIKAGGDYLLSFKGNQPTLYNAVKAALADQQMTLPAKEKVSISKKAHGRIEMRHCHVMDASTLTEDFPEWQSLKTIGVVTGYRQVKGKPPAVESRYYISSAVLTEQKLAEAVRAHGGIESFHWILDATMKEEEEEDDCQIYRENAAQNISTLRRISLNMLRAEPTKLSIRLKRKRAWIKSSFLEQVLVAGFTRMSKN